MQPKKHTLPLVIFIPFFCSKTRTEQRQTNIHPNHIKTKTAVTKTENLLHFLSFGAK